MDPPYSLSLKDLTHKLVMLMALTQAARIQTLHLILWKDIIITKDSITVKLDGNLKQSRPKFNMQAVTFKVYTKDSSLCV